MTEHDPFLNELQQRAERAHQSAHLADDAPPDLWQRVRAQIETPEEEIPEMNVVSMPVSTGPSYTSAAPRRAGSVGHYANLAATIALVIAVAIAGWFATMQLNQSGGSNDQFAFAPATPEVADATCDVEPVSAEEAMMIAKNPYSIMEGDEEVMKDNGIWSISSILQLEYAEPSLVYPYMMINDVVLEHVDEERFADATGVAQQFIDCVANGTVGQVWRLVDPVVVHHEIHEALPMFISEEDAQAYITDWVAQPNDGRWGGGDFNHLEDHADIQMNPNRDLAYVVESAPWGSVHMVSAVIAPIMYVNHDGTIALETEITGFPIQSDGTKLRFSRNLMIGYSGIDGNWYVIGTAPTDGYTFPNP